MGRRAIAPGSHGDIIVNPQLVDAEPWDRIISSLRAPQEVTDWLVANPEAVMAIAKKASGTRRANTKWTARTQYRSSVTGKKLPLEATAATEAEARQLLASAIRDRQLKEKGGLTALSTVEELVEELRKQQMDRRLSENTLRDYDHVIRRAIVPHLGRRRIEDLTVGTINEWLRLLGSQKQYHDARVARSLMTEACKIAIGFGALVGVNPVDNAIEAPKNPAKVQRAVDGEQVEVAQLEDLNRLREVLLLREHTKKSGPRPDNQLRSIVELWAASSRPSEVLALRVQDVDLTSQPKTMTISGTILEGSRVRKPSPKTSSGYRIFILTDAMVAAIQRRLDVLGPDVAPDTLLFSDRNGRAHDLGKLRKALTRVLESADLPHMYPYMLRRTAATAINRQLGLEATADTLGHAPGDVATARVHYIQFEPRAIPESVTQVIGKTFPLLDEAAVLARLNSAE